MQTCAMHIEMKSDRPEWGRPNLSAVQGSLGRRSCPRAWLFVQRCVASARGKEDKERVCWVSGAFPHILCRPSTVLKGGQGEDNR